MSHILCTVLGTLIGWAICNAGWHEHLRRKPLCGGCETPSICRSVGPCGAEGSDDAQA